MAQAVPSRGQVLPPSAPVVAPSVSVGKEQPSVVASRVPEQLSGGVSAEPNVSGEQVASSGIAASTTSKLAQESGLDESQVSALMRQYATGSVEGIPASFLSAVNNKALWQPGELEYAIQSAKKDVANARVIADAEAAEQAAAIAAEQAAAEKEAKNAPPPPESSETPVNNKGYEFVNVTSINTATGKADHYIVHDPKGNTVFLTPTQVQALGLTVPDALLHAQDVQQALVTGGGNAAARLTSQFALQDAAKALAKSADLPMDKALEAVTLWQKDPTDVRFLQMSTDQINQLMKVSPLTRDQVSVFNNAAKEYYLKNTVEVGGKSGNVQRIAREDYDRLQKEVSPTMLATLNEQGIDAFNKTIKQEAKTQEQMGVGRAMEGLPTSARETVLGLYNKSGIGAVNEYFAKQRAEWESGVLPKLPKDLQNAYNNAKATDNYDDFNKSFRSYQDTLKQQQATWEKTTLPTLPQNLQSLYKEGVASGDMTEFDRAFGSFQTENKAAVVNWETNDLPKLPKDMQEAYQQGKESGDYTNFTTLAGKYNIAYREWASKFTPTQLSEIQSGKYQIKDPTTGEMVSVTKEDYNRIKASSLQNMDIATADRALNEAIAKWTQENPNATPEQKQAGISSLPEYKNYTTIQSLASYIPQRDLEIAKSVQGWINNPGGLPRLIEYLGQSINNSVVGLSKEINDSSLPESSKTVATALVAGLGLFPKFYLMPTQLGTMVAGIIGFDKNRSSAQVANDFLKATSDSLHNITNLFTGKSKGNIVQKVDDLFNSILTLQMMAGISGGVARAGEGAITKASPNYVPARSLIDTSSTIRVRFTPEQIAKFKADGYTDADIIKLGDQINEQLVKGKKSAEVTIDDVMAVVKNVPYQMYVDGYSILSSMPDIRVLDRGVPAPIIGSGFWGSAKAAIEPMIRSYLKGIKASVPGIAEIRIADPSILRDIMKQEKLIEGGKTIEPEMRLPSLDELNGMGYRLVRIPDNMGGRGVTYDASLGRIQIRRYTLERVTDNPTGLKQVRIGRPSPTGATGIGDLHGTTNYKAVYDNINAGFDKPIISGDPNRPSTWNWVGERQSVVILGDTIDRGAAYDLWRDTFNRLHDQAKATGGSVDRLLGNHELAYLQGEAIPGIEYTDALRAIRKSQLKSDISSGRVKAAVAHNGELYTHAGVSLNTFRELRGKTADFMANRFNNTLLKSVKNNRYNDKMYARGREESGFTGYLKGNVRKDGGIFWLRPQEALAKDINLGFRQIVGHNPGWAVREIWGKNFIETDVSRRTGGSGAYYNTPHMRTESVDIKTEPVSPGTAPKLTVPLSAKLTALAIKDTIADFITGWDGRSRALKNMIESEEAVKVATKSLEAQARARKAAGDTFGVQSINKQIRALTSGTLSDYVYGGIGFWRDLVMGRAKAVDILDGSRVEYNRIPTIVNTARTSILRMSDADTRAYFGKSRAEISRALSTKGLNTSDPQYNERAMRVLENLRDIIDDGIERSVRPLIDSDSLASAYAMKYKEYLDRYAERAYQPSRGIESVSRRGGEQPPEESGYERVPRQLPRERASEVRAPSESVRTVSELRVPVESRTPPYERVSYNEAIRGAESVRGVQAPPESPRPPAEYTERTGRGVIPSESTVIRGLKGGIKRVGNQAEVPTGAAVWKQGLFWRWIPPDELAKSIQKSYALPRGVTPMGAIKLTGRTPADTIQIVGSPNASVPALHTDLGFEHIDIAQNAKSIDFAQDAAKAEGIDRTKMTDYYPRHSVSRLDMAETPPPRTGQSTDRLTRASVVEEQMQGVSRPSTNKVVLETEAEPESMEQGADLFYSAGAELLPARDTPKNRTTVSKSRPKRSKEVAPSGIMRLTGG